MPDKHSTVLCVAAMLVSGSLSHGSISLVSQSRTVSATATITDPMFPSTDSHSASAPGFGPWNQTVTANNSYFTSSSSSRTTQDTNIALTGFTGTLSMMGQRTGSYGSSGGSSTLSVTFSVLDAPADYSIVFTSGVLGDNNFTSATARLSGSSGSLFQWTRHRASSTWPSSPQSGILPVGTYTLDLATTGGAGFGDQAGTSASISWNLSIPDPTSVALGLLGIGWTCTQRRRCIAHAQA